MDAETRKLMDVTKASLYKGIEAAVAGNRTGDIGHAVQSYAESFGFSVVRELEGHGLGKEMHEAPGVPNYGASGARVQTCGWNGHLHRTNDQCRRQRSVCGQKWLGCTHFRPQERGSL